MGMVEHNYIDFGEAASESGLPSVLSERYLRAVREFCHTWGRAIKTICLYPATNPLPDEFRAKFLNALAPLLEERETLTLTIFAEGFDCGGQTIYETFGDNNLAYMFFADGVRQLVFHQGLTREESDRFLAICAEVYGTPGARADVANRLWEAAFEHIKHFTVDRLVDGTYIEPVRDDVLSDRAHSFTGRPSPDTPEPGADMPGAPEDTALPNPYAGIQSHRYIQIMKAFGDVSSLTTAERDRVIALSCGDSDQPGEELGMDLLSEMIRSSESWRMINESVAVLERQFEHAVQHNRWDLARRLLVRWHDDAAQAPPLVARRLTAALPVAAQRQNIERLAAYLNTNPQADLEPVSTLLPLFGPQAITPITAMLGTLEHRPARMMVCDFLGKHGRETVDLIGGFIYDKRWYVARNVAMILGEIGHERGLMFLRKSAKHSDPRVRLETLRAVQRMHVPEAERILRDFLEDSDDSLRCRALRALGQRPGSCSPEWLKEKLDTESLTGKDPAELRELLTAYARLGGGEAVESLNRLAHRSPMLGRARWRPVRLAAIWALGASTDPRAQSELQILSRGRDRELAQAARLALTRQARAEDDAQEDRLP
ncbi:MAG: HEAT repeat domain-containing protein [Candidatus Zixiibacteriota bacterium]